MNKYSYIGKPTMRIDGLEKISGSASYIEDLDFGPGLLYAAVVESPHAHADILDIDISEAEKVPGVVKVVTGDEFPYKFGLYMADRYIFAQDRVRFVGEQVAAVIARTERIAKRASKLVKVKYRPIKPLFDPVKAFEDGNNLLHPGLGEYECVPWFFPRCDTNVAHYRKTLKGDPEKGFRDADLIYEDTYRVPRYSHSAIEIHGAVGLYDMAGRLTVWASSQSPYTQRNIFANALSPLGITHKDVRVIAPFVGGGFGGKAGVTMEILAAALATSVKGSPVKILWSREQEFYNTYQRQAIVANIKMGVKKDGTIISLEHKLYWDCGAYVEYGANVVNAVGLSATGPYRVPNVKIDSIGIYTNLPPCGPYRGFGYSEFHFGLESHIDQVAHRLGIKPLEFRKRNAIKEGDILAYGVPMNPSGLSEAIDKVEYELNDLREMEDSGNKDEVSRVSYGRGYACFWKAPAMPPNASSAAFLKFNEDASLNILVSGMELGQGYLTVMAQIASEILSIPPEKIRVETPDTDRNPYEWQTVASHVTWSCGNAVKKAAEDARDQIFRIISEAKIMDLDDLYLDDQCVKSRTDAEFKLSLRNFVIDGLMMDDGTFRGGPIIGRGKFMPEFTSAIGDPETSQGGHPNVHYTVGAAGVLLRVDNETGRIDILKAVEAIDAGKAINPDLAKGQITGGLLQGIATALYEDMRFDEKGNLLTNDFRDYKIPTSMDIPEKVVPILVEVPQPDGPFGARGIGEHPMIPAAPMIANAVENATGIRIRSMPITSEKIALAQLHRENDA